MRNPGVLLQNTIGKNLGFQQKWRHEMSQPWSHFDKYWPSFLLKIDWILFSQTPGAHLRGCEGFTPRMVFVAFCIITPSFSKILIFQLDTFLYFSFDSLRKMFFFLPFFLYQIFRQQDHSQKEAKAFQKNVKCLAQANQSKQVGKEGDSQKFQRSIVRFFCYRMFGIPFFKHFGEKST